MGKPASSGTEGLAKGYLPSSLTLIFPSVTLTKGDGKEHVTHALSAPRPTLETLTSLFPTGTQIWDANLGSMAQ